MERRLAAIVSTDVVGYSRLMGADEAGTLARMKAHRVELWTPAIEKHGGRVVGTAGDSLLIEHASAVAAVESAIAVQVGMVEREIDVPENQKMRLRVGINIGEVIVDGDDIYGDGVNVAARLQEMATPGGISISRNVMEQVAGKLEAAFEDAGPHSMKNIAEPVHVWRWVAEGQATASLAGADGLLSLPDKPSIAVLPFDNLSDEREQAFFADGLVDDIITTLSKLSGLSVIARNSSFVYKGRSVDIRQVATELGVRYVLEGSVRKAANRIRVTAQLIDAASGAHLWAERYDRALDDIFAVQDEITLVLATEMQVKLTEGEQARLRFTTTSNVEAWTHWVEGLSHFRQPVTKDQLGPARACWEKALAIDPAAAPVHAMLGFVHYADARFGWWDDRETALGKARACADRALDLDPEQADAYTTSSLVNMLKERYDDALADAKKAVELAPGSTDVAVFASFVLASAGFPDDAVVHMEKAMRLSPNYPANYLGHLGNAYRLSGRIDEAIAAFKSYHARHPGFGLTDLVIAYQQSDEPELAKQTAEELLAARRNFTIDAWANTQFRADKTQLDGEIDALRSAGLPMGQASDG